jgi:hypothetical protein
MATYGKLTNLSTQILQYDLISLVDFPLTGPTSNFIDFITLTDGMIVALAAQTTAAEIGVYTCSVVGDNYTLTQFVSLNTGTTFNNPFIFQIAQGINNQGLWRYTDIAGIISFFNINQFGKDLLWEPVGFAGVDSVTINHDFNTYPLEVQALDLNNNTLPITNIQYVSTSEFIVTFPSMGTGNIYYRL